jgi:hypothetical protein
VALACSLSTATHLGIYPALLLPPLIMLVSVRPLVSATDGAAWRLRALVWPITVYFAHLAALALQAREMIGSWSFARTALSLCELLASLWLSHQ